MRVWSTDWWIDPQAPWTWSSRAREAAAVRAAVEATALAETEPAPPAVEADEAFPGDPEGVPADAAASAWVAVEGADFQLTVFDDLAGRLDVDRFQEANHTPILREMIARGAPLRDDALVERIARVHGIRRSGRLVRERVLERGAAHLEKEPGGEAVCMARRRLGPDLAPDALSLAEADIRLLDDISLRELGARCGSARRRTSRPRSPDASAYRLSWATRSRLSQARRTGGHFSA